MAGLSRGVAVGIVIALLLGGLGGLSAQQSSLIAVDQQIYPSEIYYQGSGEPDRATVTLSLEALRDEPFPLDLVLVVDRSASSDVILIRQIGREIIERLSREDRVALVSFADEATLDVELTWNERLVEERLGRLENMGRTALGEGLAMATGELIANGREDAVLVEILLVDGRSNAGRDPLPQAESAARSGIIIFAIGIGQYLQEDLLDEITGMTGGAFFRRYEEGVLEGIFSALYRDLVGTGITITRTLAEGFAYEGASLNPPTEVIPHDGAVTLEWYLEELAIGESWSTSFEISYLPQVSGRRTMEVDQEPGTVSFTDFRHRQQQLEIPALVLTVRTVNQPPQADFEFSPAEPSTLDTVVFRDLSSDPDGEIVRWEWDFGDGTTSAERNPTHRYARDGVYTVNLTVTDDEGATASIAKEITVFTVKAEVTREINTYLHIDQSLPGETFRVTVTIEVRVDLFGLGIDENLPDGWTITPVDSAGAAYHPGETQWLFVSKVPAGTVKTIVYDVTVPSDTELGIYSVNGNISSASPGFEMAVGGENQVEITDRLPISWVIARWDTQNDRFDIQLDDYITFDQIQQAVAWWLEGQVIENTGDAVIDLKTMEELVAYWLTDTPVYEPLP